VRIHLYGKRESRPGKKMGHFTVVGEVLEDVIIKAAELKEIIHVTGSPHRQ
jgi:5-(carboxyamino)imidazole ribonucleotide synthase